MPGRSFPSTRSEVSPAVGTVVTRRNIILDAGVPRPRADLPLNPYQRHMGRECKMKIRGPKGRLLCRWCGIETKPPRITFCSETCVSEWRLRTDGTFARQLVLARDRGVCSCCGIDTLSLLPRIHTNWNDVFRVWADAQGFNGSLTESQRDQWQAHRREVVEKRDAARAEVDPGFVDALRSGRSDLWDADHILPVEHGGGQCGLSNYQTLCIVCHLKKNVEGHAKRSKKTQRRTGRRNYRKR